MAELANSEQSKVHINLLEQLLSCRQFTKWKVLAAYSQTACASNNFYRISISAKTRATGTTIYGNDL